MGQISDKVKGQKSVYRIVSLAAIFSIGYAVLRYNIFGAVPWKDLPFYVLNKAISLTAIILFTIGSSLKFESKSKVQSTEKRLDISKKLEVISFLLIKLHVIMSLMLFKSEIFAKFFEDNGTLSLFGGLSMVAGIISFVLLWDIKLNSRSKEKNIYTLLSLPKTLNMAMVFIIIHLFFMGYSGWITPSKWNGGLPPISLIAFIFSSFGLIINLFSKSEGSTLNNQNI